MTRYFGTNRIIQQGEAVIIIGSAALLAWLFIHFDAFDNLASFVSNHESWQLDELVSALCVGGLASIVLLFRRASEMKREIRLRQRAEANARSLARHDPLTGLPNRRQLNEDLVALLTSVAGKGDECAVFLIDLDRFKTVNDVHGHGVGDALLIRVAERLKSVCRGDATIARLGGDEFVCILRYRAGAEAPARLAAQIIRALG
ncbi:MAG: GGDEF domain-containing protein, partial [Sphingomicrobium sp.]